MTSVVPPALVTADRLRHRVVGVPAEDDIDAGDAAGKFQIDIHAVVRQQNDGVDFVVAAQGVDHFLQFVVADTEGPVRREAFGMRDRHIGKRLSDDGDPATADLLDGRAA